MKRFILISFALALVTSLLALAQETAKPGEVKQDTMKAEKASTKATSSASLSCQPVLRAADGPRGWSWRSTWA